MNLSFLHETVLGILSQREKQMWKSGYSRHSGIQDCIKHQPISIHYSDKVPAIEGGC